jgi:NitT/TauT family transport system substrate-binding protein
VIAGEAEMSWGGPMRLLYALDANPSAGCVAFAEIVGREPTLLVGRTPKPAFRMGDLEGASVGVFSEAPTPWICLKHDLRLAGADVRKVKAITGRSMEDNAQALREGEVDAIQVFEPVAQNLIDEGAGHLWYATAQRGPTSFTTLFTTRRVIDEQPEAILRMTRAVRRTLEWVHANDGMTLAKTVHAWLPEIPLEVLAKCCDAYKKLGLWNRDPVVDPQGFAWKRDAMFEGGEIGRKLAYEDCVEPRFAAQVMREQPPA